MTRHRRHRCLKCKPDQRWRNVGREGTEREGTIFGLLSFKIFRSFLLSRYNSQILPTAHLNVLSVFTVSHLGSKRLNAKRLNIKYIIQLLQTIRIRITCQVCTPTHTHTHMHACLNVHTHAMGGEKGHRITHTYVSSLCDPFHPPYTHTHTNAENMTCFQSLKI